MNKMVHLVLATAEYDLYLPMLTTMQIENWRKMCKLMRKYSWMNSQTITAIQNWLQSEIDRTKQEWHDASARYTDEYELPYKDKKKSRKIAGNNKRLLTAVKDSKRKHERTKKFFDIFKEEIE